MQLPSARSGKPSVRLGLALAVGLLAATPTQAATRVPCAEQPGELARSKGAALYVEGDTLYACAPAVRSRYRVLRATAKPRITLGPWTEGALVSVSNVDAAWTQRTLDPQGNPVDLIWAQDLRRGRRWVKGIDPIGDATTVTTGTTPQTDRTVVGLRVFRDVVAWVTGSGALIASPRQTNVDLDGIIGGDPIGKGSPGAKGMLRTELSETPDHRIHIGTFPAYAAAAGASLQIRTYEFVGSDFGGCDNTSIIGITIRPIEGARRVGGTWPIDTDDTVPDCDRAKIER